MDEKFVTIIKPATGVCNINLKELWEYKDLTILFIKRNFIAQYKQTVLGPLWAIIQPLLTTLVFTFVFGNVAGLAVCGNVPPFLFYMCGNISWQYFSGCLTETSNTFIANSGIMGKVYFPRLVMPVSVVFTRLISFAIQMIMFFVFLFLNLFFSDNTIQIHMGFVFLPVLVLQMALLGLGCGIIVSALTTKYRDLAMLVNFGVQLWMYATPVAYSLSVFEGSALHKIMLLNPMTSIIQSVRYVLLGADAGAVNVKYYVLSWVFTLVVLGVGVLLFSKVEKTFMDTI